MGSVCCANIHLLVLVVVNTMMYGDMPMIIPLLATGYLLTVYLLIILAQKKSAKDQG
jgi:hypothetical protein